jgi:N-methylhydantoinase A/oxoprolinase/acetone carboxylase beta subunit
MAEIVSLADGVAAVVRDGDTLAMEGFTHLIPFAAGHEVIRQGRRELTLARMTPDVIYDQLIGVQPAQAVHVAGETARLLEVGEVPDDGRSAPVQEVADGREPVAVASVDDDLVPVVEQRLRGRSSETVCGAGDEDACHISGGERAAGEWLCRLRRTPLVGQHQHHSGAAVGQCWWTWTSQSSGAVRQFP